MVDQRRECLVTNIFFFSHKLFHTILNQGRLNSELFGKDLTNGRLRAKNCLRSPESFKSTREES